MKAPHFWHLEGYPNETARDIVAEFHAALREREYRPIPWRQVRRMFSRRKLLVRLLYPFSGPIGRKRNQPIRIEADRCVRCGRCVKECPAGAISMDTGVPAGARTGGGGLFEGGPDTGGAGVSLDARISRDPSKCAHCYHCVTVCAAKAVACDIEKVKNLAEFNRRVVGTEEPASRIFI